LTSLASITAKAMNHGLTASRLDTRERNPDDHGRECRLPSYSATPELLGSSMVHRYSYQPMMFGRRGALFPRPCFLLIVDLREGRVSKVNREQSRLEVKYEMIFRAKAEIR
jgi:hypothetical protein